MKNKIIWPNAATLESVITLPTKSATIEGWVARDVDGSVFLFLGMPLRMYNYWWCNDSEYLELPEFTFPSVTWNSEPLKVRLTLTPIEQ